MKLAWQVDTKDVQKVRAFYGGYEHHHFVQKRWDRNVQNPPASVSRNEFWLRMVECLLTTQQRSGPESAVMRFVEQPTFPLSYECCLEAEHLDVFCEAAITQFGGIRRGKKIGQAIRDNLGHLEAGGWKEAFGALEGLHKDSPPIDERRVARFFDNHLSGFGPKQSRNLLQTMGFTRHEIPVDSRITKWLNRFSFPVRLEATSLQGEEYYCFVLDGIQALCHECKLLPCMLDAAIFVSFDEKPIA